MLLQNLPATATRLLPRDSDDEGGNCVYAIPGPNGHVDVDACNAYYNYDPQFAPAVAVAVIFGILTAAHVFEAVMFKKVLARCQVPTYPDITAEASINSYHSRH